MALGVQIPIYMQLASPQPASRSVGQSASVRESADRSKNLEFAWKSEGTPSLQLRHRHDQHHSFSLATILLLVGFICLLSCWMYAFGVVHVLVALYFSVRVFERHGLVIEPL